MAVFDLDELIKKRGGRSFSDPAYADTVNYPDSLTLGDTLFPLLYIYYYGADARKKKIGNPFLFEKGLKEYTANRARSESAETDEGRHYERLTVMAKKFCLMFTSAIDTNAQWAWMFTNAAANTMKKYTSRLMYDPNRPLPGSTYYRQHNTRTGKDAFSPLPIINGNNSADIESAMEALRILFENKLIMFDYNLGIRPINIYTGALAEERSDVVMLETAARFLGLPSQGVFTVNQTPKGAMMYHTFSGIDITALASLNTVVSRLDHLMSCSWSIHKGATPNRTLGKSSPGGRTGGGRTIAGTMIFAITDHHPLRDLIPDTSAGRKTQVLNNPEVWKPLVLADEIPPFDVVLTLSNEYGNAAITTLYGVQVVDEGGVFGMDNLITEIAVQYTAVAMDPIMEVKLDDTGMIDPFGIMQGGYSHLWRRREMMAAGAGFSDLETAYESQYDATFDALERRRARWVQEQRALKKENDDARD